MLERILERSMRGKVGGLQDEKCIFINRRATEDPIFSMTQLMEKN